MPNNENRWDKVYPAGLARELLYELLTGGTSTWIGTSFAERIDAVEVLKKYPPEAQKIFDNFIETGFVIPQSGNGSDRGICYVFGRRSDGLAYKSSVLGPLKAKDGNTVMVRLPEAVRPAAVQPHAETPLQAAPSVPDDGWRSVLGGKKSRDVFETLWNAAAPVPGKPYRRIDSGFSNLFRNPSNASALVTTVLAPKRLVVRESRGVFVLFERMSDGIAYNDEDDNRNGRVGEAPVAVAPVAPKAPVSADAALPVADIESAHSPDVEATSGDSGTRTFGSVSLLWASDAMREVVSLAEFAARFPMSVLITGETGVGKELCARLIHEASPRRGKPFIPVTCSAIPETLIESELFGFEKGSFTGAHKTTLGAFARADGGTLFLDEIGDLSLMAQVKILRILQDKVVRRIGGSEYTSLDVRIIAATNKNLAAAMRDKEFRDDLYYRLCGFPIVIPPLRERPEDISVLIKHFFGIYNTEMGGSLEGISRPALEQCRAYPWPGNVRELENAVRVAILLAMRGGSRCIEPHHFPFRAAGRMNAVAPIPQKLKEIEKDAIVQAFESNGRNVAKTAVVLGIKRTTLHRKLMWLGILKKKSQAG